MSNGLEGIRLRKRKSDHRFGGFETLGFALRASERIVGREPAAEPMEE
jgi:hypothetical protein